MPSFRSYTDDRDHLEIERQSAEKRLIEITSLVSSIMPYDEYRTGSLESMIDKVGYADACTRGKLWVIFLCETVC